MWDARLCYERTHTLTPYHLYCISLCLQKGFPEETETLQQELEKFFEQFGQINVVRMRREERAKPKKFKGSVFVEFASMDEMTKFLNKAKSEEGAIKYNDQPLVIMSK